VGFDLRARDRLGADRARSAALSIGLFCLAGLGAVLALFAGHNARLARRLYQEAKAELARKERLAALGHRAAGLAHEIRNPLGAIDGLCRHLTGRTQPEDREALEVMLTSVGRLNRAVTGFLNYARPLEIKTATLELGGLARRTAALVAHDAKAGSVEIILDLEEAWIAGDESLLAQALLNLYLNAIEAARHTPGGGGLEVSLKKTDRQARLVFRDNGPGFSPEQLAQPFAPYFTTKADGTGLGLALVEKSVRAHAGGDITLESPPPDGAAVTLTFNLTEA
jgi:two-component system sensor histidine kinase HydH